MKRQEFTFWDLQITNGWVLYACMFTMEFKTNNKLKKGWQTLLLYLVISNIYFIWLFCMYMSICHTQWITRMHPTIIVKQRRKKALSIHVHGYMQPLASRVEPKSHEMMGAFKSIFIPLSKKEILSHASNHYKRRKQNRKPTIILWPWTLWKFWFNPVRVTFWVVESF